MLLPILKNTEHGALPGNRYGGFCIVTIQPPSLGSFIMEIWKDIKGYEGYYKVSNFGNVKRLVGIKVRKERILKPKISQTGYYCIVLCVNSKKRMYKNHRLVAQAFILNPENKPCVNHRDGKKLNNHVGNLEWATYKEDRIHAVEMGLLPRGEKHSNSKLNEFQVRVIRKCDDLTLIELGKIFNMSSAGIHDIRKRINWKHII